MRAFKCQSKLFAFVALLLSFVPIAQAQREVIFERTSKYQFIQVYDEDGMRTMAFNGSPQSRVSLTDPLTGHFEYTEYFQMPFLWNPSIQRVLMAGLGGGSAQRAYARWFTNAMVDTVEIDPVVVEAAQKYFNVAEAAHSKIHIDDTRQYLRRATNSYDLILMDAYAYTRYGSSLPPHLTTKEFFALAASRLTTNGILAYNVIGQMSGPGDKLVGALYRTMKTVFPQVYLFPALETHNVVFVATKSAEHFTWEHAQTDARECVQSGLIPWTGFSVRAKQFEDQAPKSAANAIILTDDYAPIESLMDHSE